jgi:hypothetical protein
MRFGYVQLTIQPSLGFALTAKIHNHHFFYKRLVF